MAMLLVGCGGGTGASLPATTYATTSIHGQVHGGQQPVAGSLVQLWETSTSGYGGTATQLVASTTTATNGTFTFPTANIPANCATGPFAYITARGGDPTGGTGSNPDLLEVAALGSCSNVGASTYVFLNEVTTVAAAYALGSFASDASGVISVGAPSSNAQGLADAVANALLLANTTTGTANASTPAMLLPTAAIDTLADIAASCVNSLPPFAASSSCTRLMSYATPPGTSATAPTDTFQALVNIARYPGSNVNALLGLDGGTASPYQPTLAGGDGTTSALNDLSLGISFPNLTLAHQSTQATFMTIDATDNVWVVGANNGTSNYISELTSSSATGTPALTNTLDASITSSQNVRGAAFDTGGNLWLTNGNHGEVIELPASSLAAPTATGTVYTYATTALSNNTYALAIDSSSNVWTAAYGGLGNCVNTGTNKSCAYVEFPAGNYATPVTTFNGTAQYTASVRGLAIDKNGNIWSADYGQFGSTTPGNSVEILAPASTTATLTTVTVGAAGAGTYGVAIDASNDGWVTTATAAGLYEVAAGGTSATSAAAASPATVSTTASTPASTSTGAVPVGGLAVPQYLAIDGAGNIFVANSGYGTVVQYAPTYNGSTNGYLSPFYGFSPSLTAPTATESVTGYSDNGTTGVITFTTATGANNFVTGQSVAVSGLTGADAGFNGTYSVIATGLSSSKFEVSSTNTSGAANASVTATAAYTPYDQSLFACTTASSVTSCAPTNTGLFGAGNDAIAIDRAGSVWTLSTANSGLLEILGVAAPANPVLASEGYGAKP
jgi:hypothetical protein